MEKRRKGLLEELGAQPVVGQSFGVLEIKDLAESDLVLKVGLCACVEHVQLGLHALRGVVQKYEGVRLSSVIVLQLHCEGLGERERESGC